MTEQNPYKTPQPADLRPYWFVVWLSFLVGIIGGMTIMKSVMDPKTRQLQLAIPRDADGNVIISEMRPVDVSLEPEIGLGVPDVRQIADSERIGTAKSFISLFGEAPNAEKWLLEDRNARLAAFWRNDFRSDKIRATVNGLALTIGDHPEPDERPWEWAGSEMRTYERYGYGRYEVFMRAAKGSGLISSLFTFTGEPFGDPQDEIDIEFNGSKPRQVELNVWQNGSPFGAKTVALPFDTSDEFHLYAFEWHPDSITWYIDGLPVHRVEAKDHKLPDHAGYLYMNLWTGKMYDWHGRPDFEDGAAAEYRCVSYLESGDTGRKCSDFYRADAPLTVDWVLSLD